MDDLLHLGRILLQDTNGATADDECARSADDQSTHRSLRVGGLFIILVVTACGLCIPLLTKGYTKIFFLARTFGAGVILSTALVHILADAAGDLSNPCLHLSTEYPWADAIAGMMLLFTFATEYCVATYLRHRFGGSNPIKQGAHLEAVDMEANVDAQQDPEKLEAKRILNAKVSAYTLEAGVVIHSVFVGLAYGVSTDLGTIRALTIALGFHQGIEGISLGCTFLDAKFSNLKYMLFGACYVIVTPIGIAIGLGVGNSYSDGSKAALGTQGTLNAIAAGILLYNGIADLIIPSFLGHGHAHGDPEAPTTARPTWLTAAGFLSMVAGYCAQGVIAKWA